MSMPSATAVHVRARRRGEDRDRPPHAQQGHLDMQPLAAYYVFVANEEARNAEPATAVRVRPPKHSPARRGSPRRCAVVRPSAAPRRRA
jgi:hypothetical protein